MTDFSPPAVRDALAEQASSAKKAFLAALRSAKSEFPTVIKTTNAGNRYRYADLHAIAAQIDPVLDKHKLSYRYATESLDGDRTKVTCILSHDDGWSESSSLISPPDTSGNKVPIQAMGSAVTYLQRYTLISLLGLAVARDDDGAATSKPVSASQVKQLKKLCEGHNEQALLDHLNIKSWDELPQGDFSKVITFIKAKLAKDQTNEQAA